MGGSDQEFPLLSLLGLYAHDIRGDGNCLFNALSDQIYGHQDEHAAIRLRVIDYMREHAVYYKQFIDVHPGGGIRRNPKRKNAGAYSSPANFVPPSEADIDRVFESHLQRMANGGTWGDNMEITAFSCAYDYDVKIYQRDFAYMISGSNPDEGERKIAHIAYHTWEHYSSIRNLDGPHDGLPHVLAKVLTFEEEQSQKEKLAQAPFVPDWLVENLQKSLQEFVDKPTIKRALQTAKGNFDVAYSILTDGDGSSSSYHESSSVERDHDSDDDMHDLPNKKQDRRLSRASRAKKGSSAAGQYTLSTLTTHGCSQESFTSLDSEVSSQRASSQQSASPDQAFDDAVTMELQDIVQGMPSPPRDTSTPVKPPVRLKLLPPRPPELPQRVGKTQLRQPGPRLSARDKKDIKKQAQKAARKERQQAASKGSRTQSLSSVGIPLRAKGVTEIPPVETLRTLYI